MVKTAGTAPEYCYSRQSGSVDLASSFVDKKKMILVLNNVKYYKRPQHNQPGTKPVHLVFSYITVRTVLNVFLIKSCLNQSNFLKKRGMHPSLTHSLWIRKTKIIKSITPEFKKQPHTCTQSERHIETN